MNEARLGRLMTMLGAGTSRRGTLGLLGSLGLALLPDVSSARSKHKTQRKRNPKSNSEGRTSNGEVSAQGQPPATGLGQIQTLAAKWWTWVIGQGLFPPIQASGPVDCAAGQRGGVWFLAGTDFALAPPVERTCSVPAGTKLFFPVVNNFEGDPPGFYTPPTDPDGFNPDNTQLQALRTIAAQQINAYTPSDLTATVDGRDVPMVRARSAIFPLHLGETNPFGNAPAGTYLLASDGYWVLLDPLPRGEHRIHFFAPVRTVGTEDLDVTYVITVV